MKRIFWIIAVAIGYYAIPLSIGLIILSGVVTVVIIHPDPIHSSGVFLLPCLTASAVWIICRSWIVINQIIDLNLKH